VIYAVKDPNPIAAGGAQRLLDAGIEVVHHQSGEVTQLHRAWVHRITTSRPYVIWKIATTLDGRIAASDGSSQWISSEQSRADVQVLRAQSDAILVGTATVLADNPTLRPRIDGAPSPLRIVMGESEIPEGFNIHDDKSKTVFVKSRSVDALLESLKDLPINQILVEAGPTLGSALMAAGLIDELIIYQAPILLGAGKSWLEDIGISTISNASHLVFLEASAIGPDFKFRYRVESK
jgi:diaminohydroxyphosphoribosylaminopyrimidine deaminase/5-amino-6-(5-phosphoribosylamino)uracil reductase